MSWRRGFRARTQERRLTLHAQLPQPLRILQQPCLGDLERCSVRRSEQRAALQPSPRQRFCPSAPPHAADRRRFSDLREPPLRPSGTGRGRQQHAAAGSSITQREQVVTRTSSELGAPAVRLGCGDEFFPRSHHCAFTAECEFPRCLCSMTHLPAPEEQKLLQNAPSEENLLSGWVVKQMSLESISW